VQGLLTGLVLAALGAGVAGAGAASGAEPEQVVTLETRSGQSIRVLVQRPPGPALGSVILVAGGHGNLEISPDGRLGWGAPNQLVRTRALYAAAGFVAAVPDIASEFKRPGGADEGYRSSEGHARDLGGVVAYLRLQAPPVWLIGTSRGAMSVANAAARLSGPQRPDGIVITSGLLMSTRGQSPSAQSTVRGLDRIAVPTLLLNHELDQCRFSPASDAPAFRKLLTGAPRVDVKTLSGGISEGPPCESWAYHGFNGLDQDVVTLVTAWLKTNTPSH